MLNTFQSFNARRRSANSKMEKGIKINNKNVFLQIGVADCSSVGSLLPSCLSPSTFGGGREDEGNHRHGPD